MIKKHLNECTNEMEKQYLIECVEDCHKPAKDSREIKEDEEDELKDLVSKIEKKIGLMHL